MPLIKPKSKAAFSKDAAPEAAEGKPGSLAISYAVKRKGAGKAKPTASVQMEDGAMEGPKTITEAIMGKSKNRKPQMLADGGTVLDNAEEDSEQSLENMNEDAIKKELYDDSQLMADPLDSNEHSVHLDDEDMHDMASKIRARLANRRGV